MRCSLLLRLQHIQQQDQKLSLNLKIRQCLFCFFKGQEVHPKSDQNNLRSALFGVSLKDLANSMFAYQRLYCFVFTTQIDLDDYRNIRRRHYQ